jgi:subtilase family serine protease
MRCIALCALVAVAGLSGAAAPASAGSSLKVVCPPVPVGYARCFSLTSTPFGVTSPTGYGPADLQSAYKLPSSTAGTGQTVAIVDAFDDPTAESDLAQYRSFYGLPPCTTANGCFRKVNQTGGTLYPPPSPDWGLEISLDLDMVSAVCPNCHILLVEATTNLNTDLYTAVDTAAALGANAISNSYGGGESSGETASDTHFNHPSRSPRARGTTGTASRTRPRRATSRRSAGRH